MCKVFNLSTYSPHKDGDAIYIGRPSKWGNPFKVTKDCTRGRAIEQFRLMVLSDPEFIKTIKEELRGKNLVCHCSPKPCHGDVLLEIANNMLLDFFD